MPNEVKAILQVALDKVNVARQEAWEHLRKISPQNEESLSKCFMHSLFPTPRTVEDRLAEAARQRDFYWDRLLEEEAENRSLQQQLQQKDDQIQQLRQQLENTKDHRDAVLKGKSQELAASASEIEKLKAVVSDTQEELAATQAKLSQ